MRQFLGFHHAFHLTLGILPFPPVKLHRPIRVSGEIHTRVVVGDGNVVVGAVVDVVDVVEIVVAAAVVGIVVVGIAGIAVVVVAVVVEIVVVVVVVVVIVVIVVVVVVVVVVGIDTIGGQGLHILT